MRRASALAATTAVLSPAGFATPTRGGHLLQEDDHRDADRTWKHPKLVLARRRGLRRPRRRLRPRRRAATSRRPASPTAPPRASGRRSCCATRSATTRTRRSSSSSASPGGGPLDPTDPPVRREVDRLSSGMEKVDHIGHVINPLAEPQAGADADRPRRRVAGDHRPPRHRRHRGRRRPRRRRGRTADRHRAGSTSQMGGFAAGLQRDQRPDPHRPDQGRADRLPDPRPASCCSSSAASSPPGSRC